MNKNNDQKRESPAAVHIHGRWLAASIVHVRRFFGSATLQLSMFAFSYN